MARRVASLLLVLILAQIVTASNDTVVEDQNNKLNAVKTRRKDKSTSSDGDSAEKKEGASESLNVAFTSDSSTSSESAGPKKNKKKKDHEPKSTVERRGWRKWHRKCTKCPEDMQKKWRDPSIKWICGAYQRARRSFKSLCMMHYRNCQDGTMFTKVADHRCPNGTKQGILPYYHHFFYDYKVVLTDESTDTSSKTISGSDESSSSSVSESELEKRLPPFRFNAL
ncbi:hypothetical protein PYW07_009268 [Mythimna separata]|uniref:Uncharacterized protein n=1 Tax=Mythimna separata TaxID=271217 RepID=A0AAD7YBA3_MYTSE|nr:hypothetical protein PYW07_009268 [Mythimna separata]